MLILAEGTNSPARAFEQCFCTAIEERRLAFSVLLCVKPFPGIQAEVKAKTLTQRTQRSTEFTEQPGSRTTNEG
jgi:hypothetical protein